MSQSNDESIDNDFDDDFNDEDQTPDYWSCYGCGKTWGKRPMGGMCTTCGSYVEEDYF